MFTRQFGAGRMLLLAALLGSAAPLAAETQVITAARMVDVLTGRMVAAIWLAA